MILFILAAYWAYKKASATGRNGILWAFITAAVYLGTQLVLAMAIGLGIGIGSVAFGWSETLYDDWSLLISVICTLGSFVSVWLVFRYLDKLPPEENTFSPPPAPPTFDGK